MEVFNEHVVRRLDRKEPLLVETLVLQLQARYGILCYLGGTSYAFVHRTFFEYFCALAWKYALENDDIREKDLNKMFLAHANDPTWNEVLILLCGMIQSKRLTTSLELLASKNTILAGKCVEQLLNRRASAGAVSEVRDRFTWSIKNATDSFFRHEINIQKYSTILNLFVRLWPDNEARIFIEELLRIRRRGPGHRCELILALVRTWPVN